MSEYLSKEELKQWRSSLEKITLEEYAARLGKRIEEARPTRDLADIVMQNKPAFDWAPAQAERLSSIAARAAEREREIAPSFAKISRDVMKNDKKSAKSEALLRDAAKVTFKKALTEREQKVFDYLLQNNGKIVYAKDLAKLLDLPRDYVYKYIKNLRTKIEGDNLQNADRSGFVLTV